MYVCVCVCVCVCIPVGRSELGLPCERWKELFQYNWDSNYLTSLWYKKIIFCCFVIHFCNHVNLLSFLPNNDNEVRIAV